MGIRWEHYQAIRDRKSREIGPPPLRSDRRMALMYPSPYRAGMSSLGYQWIWSNLRAEGISAERCFLPEDVSEWRLSKTLPITYESETPLSHYRLIAVSLAYELELAGLIELLELAGIPALRRERGPQDPCILLGGPLTFSNPLPAAPFVDAMLLGEADETAVSAVRDHFECSSRETWLDAVETLPGAYIPERHGSVLPTVAKASDALLPARSAIISPDTELANMFLLEGERGCHRQCSFCVMRRSTNGGMRLVTPERILSFIPDHAPKVGLVGAAISDHPKLVPLLETLTKAGKGIGVSSLRADRVARKPEIAHLLAKSGARTLTVASDAASQALRRQIAKGTTEKHLLRCAEISKEAGLELLKVYMMVGLPGETDADIDELIAFTTELSKAGRVALGIAPFVAKRMTPLDGTPFAGIKLVEHRLKRLKRGLQGKAIVRPTSARWAWVEYMLAQGGPEAGEAVLQAVHAGGRFSDYKRALSAIDSSAARPWALQS
jgi:radical SAM superfamily enzyme YgiQ (UPF0313 family)